MQLDFYGGVLGAEHRQLVREELHDGRGAGVQAHAPAGPAGELAQLGVGALGECEEGRGPARQRVAEGVGARPLAPRSNSGAPP